MCVSVSAQPVCVDNLFENMHKLWFFFFFFYPCHSHYLIWFTFIFVCFAFLNFPYHLPQSFNKFPYVKQLHDLLKAIAFDNSKCFMGKASDCISVLFLRALNMFRTCYLCLCWHEFFMSRTILRCLIGTAPLCVMITFPICSLCTGFCIILYLCFSLYFSSCVSVWVDTWINIMCLSKLFPAHFLPSLCNSFLLCLIAPMPS